MGALRGRCGIRVAQGGGRQRPRPEKQAAQEHAFAINSGAMQRIRTTHLSSRTSHPLAYRPPRLAPSTTANAA